MAETATKTPAQVLYKGNDARIAAVRNNLVRKSALNLDAIGKLSDTEINALVAYLDPEELVHAAQDYRKAVKERLAAIKATPTPSKA